MWCSFVVLEVAELIPMSEWEVNDPPVEEGKAGLREVVVAWSQHGAGP